MNSSRSLCLSCFFLLVISVSVRSIAQINWGNGIRINHRLPWCNVPGTNEEGICVVPEFCKSAPAQSSAQRRSNNIVLPSPATCHIQGGVLYGCCPLTALTHPVQKCGHTSAFHTRVIGGRVSGVGAWPWHGALMTTTHDGVQKYKCGCTLITKHMLLTTAECVDGTKNVPDTVRLGVQNVLDSMREWRRDHKVKRFIIHPGYDRELLTVPRKNNIALVEIEVASPHPPSIHPVCLPRGKEERFVGWHPFVVGWGAVNEGGDTSPLLREAQVKVINNKLCQWGYTESSMDPNVDITPNLLCSGFRRGKGPCDGDSGGGLFIYNRHNAAFQLIGITNRQIGCGVVDTYVRVTAYLDWIHKHVNIKNVPIPTGRPSTTGKQPPTTTPLPMMELEADPQGKCGISDILHSRIVMGDRTESGAWPWHGALGYRRSNETEYECGCTVLNDKWVLTAAHCLQREIPSVVRLGAHNISDVNEADARTFEIKRMILHPGYNSTVRPVNNDIGLLELENSSPLPDHIRRICLPTAPLFQSDRLTGRSPFVTGWGSTSFSGPRSDILLETKVVVQDNQECQRMYQTIFPNRQISILAEMLCAGGGNDGKDACQGDSGGGLFLPVKQGDKEAYVIIGIVSEGFRCGIPGAPGIYTRVMEYLDWINQQIRN